MILIFPVRRIEGQQDFTTIIAAIVRWVVSVPLTRSLSHSAGGVIMMVPPFGMLPLCSMSSLLQGQITMVELAVALAVCNALIPPVVHEQTNETGDGLCERPPNQHLGTHLWEKLEHGCYRRQRIGSSIRSTRLLRLCFYGNRGPLEGIQEGPSLRRMVLPTDVLCLDYCMHRRVVVIGAYQNEISQMPSLLLELMLRNIDQVSELIR
ncbi:uncharacterized protein BJ212DRAFT_189905 [Suillus subaureus]|uniref:Uncharacterized protein n=1 Tax=Suillus subaureus TaxID=48587 RepID=A0A9P7EAT0_9AGAM|nr:uncharacterized protein BJ212DRAFT_189905 [Suillus subaureus]KAG1816395.1 hypothetical protein BJ212DRAFT_189905 [Suillus subaureus]